MSALWSAWGADAFTEQVEKATSELLPVGSEDIALNLEICDQVRAKQVPPKQAMQVLKRRVSHKNPNVVLLALGLTDICIKNGGDHFLQEVASREFMDNLVSVLRNPAGVNNDVKAKALGLIQNWSQIAQAKPAQMGYITDVYKQLKSDSKFEFPPLDPNAVASAALVETLTAPEWVDGKVCMRCRTAFTTFNRKHHCRNCGNVFCQQCSSHSMALPWFGIGQDVRVCDGCYARKGPPKNAAKLSRSKSAGSSTSSTTKHITSGRGASVGHQRSATTGSKSKRSAVRQKEDDDLALAIKLSLESSGQSSRPDAFGAPSQPSASQPSLERASNGRVLEGTDADDDPDLAAAIAASLRDWAPPQPSAPDGLNESAVAAPGQSNPAQSSLPLPPSLDLAPQDLDNILTFSQTIQAHQAHNQRSGMVGTPVPPSVQATYEKASSARPRMARNLEEGHRRHNVLVSMHDKLTEAVRLYDRLLDAQMTRPAQAYPAHGYQQASYPVAHQQNYAYGYDQPPPAHQAQYAAVPANSSSLYPQAPQHSVGAYAEYNSAPAQQWQPPQQQHDVQHYQQHQQPYAGQESAQPQNASQQQHAQSQQNPAYSMPNALGPYSNGAYIEPNHAPSPSHAGAYGHPGAPVGQNSQSQISSAAYGSGAPSSHETLSSRTEGMVQSAAAGASMPTLGDRTNVMNAGHGDDSMATSQVSADTSASGGWKQVPVQAVPPPSQPEGYHGAGGQEAHPPAPYSARHQQQPQQQYEQQPSSPAATRIPSQSIQQPQGKGDTSYLPLFPVAPHPDNGFKNERNEGLTADANSPLASPYTNAPSSAGMWQSSAGKSPSVTNQAAAEPALIEF